MCCLNLKCISVILKAMSEQSYVRLTDSLVDKHTHIEILYFQHVGIFAQVHTSMNAVEAWQR